MLTSGRKTNGSLNGRGAIENPPDPVLSPFLKWAGGKRWLPAEFPQLLPDSFHTYFEPFLGGAAIFFHLTPKRAELSDSNVELIETYRTIRTNWRDVVAALEEHQEKHCRSHYLRVRANTCSSRIQHAARFIYLNRTCWNGLYRVNLKGKFNVPPGTKSAVLLPTDDFKMLANALESARLVACDFETMVDKADAGDFLFVDPPYTANHNNNGFIKYNENLFQWKDQLRLHAALLRASKRGVKFLLTNAVHQSVIDLYHRTFHVGVLNRFSRISGRAKGRGAVEEIAVLNYLPARKK